MYRGRDSLNKMTDTTENIATSLIDILAYTFVFQECVAVSLKYLW